MKNSYKKITVAIFLILFFPGIIWAKINNDFFLSFDSIKKLLKNDPAALKQIKSKALSERVKQLSRIENYDYNLKFESSKLNSNEKVLASFLVVTQEYMKNTVKLQKAIPRGIRLEADLFTETTSTNLFKDVNTQGAGVSLSVDLWKNIWGRLERRQLLNDELVAKKTELEQKREAKIYLVNIIKSYWYLVANQESRLLVDQLLATAQKQLDESKMRFKSNVADRSQVVKNETQVAMRETLLLALAHEKSEIVKQLKQLLPELNSKNVLLGNYDISNTVQDFLVCTSLIDSEKTAPIKYSTLQNIVNILEEEQSNLREMTETHNSPDLTFASSYHRLGKAFNRGDATSDFVDNGKQNLKFGVEFNLPLGNLKKTTREVKEEMERNYYQGSKQSILGKINAYHDQTVESIKHLNKVMKIQRINTRYLKESLDLSKDKFRQARISLQELIYDQNAYLQGNLDEIKTKTMIVETVLDYFTVFNDFPCALNRNDML